MPLYRVDFEKASAERVQPVAYVAESAAPANTAAAVGSLADATTAGTGEGAA